MRRVTPLQQMESEMAKLKPQEQEELCLALVCLLRFGLMDPLLRFFGVAAPDEGLEEDDFFH